MKGRSVARQTDRGIQTLTLAFVSTQEQLDSLLTIFNQTPLASRPVVASCPAASVQPNTSQPDPYTPSEDGGSWPFWAGGGLLDSIQRLASQAGQPVSPSTVPKLASALSPVEPSPETAIDVVLQCKGETGTSPLNGGSSPRSLPGSGLTSGVQLTSRINSARKMGSINLNNSLAEAFGSGLSARTSLKHPGWQSDQPPIISSRSNVASSSSIQQQDVQSAPDDLDGKQRLSKGGLADLLHLHEFSFRIPGLSGLSTPAAQSTSVTSARSPRTAIAPVQQTGNDLADTKIPFADPSTEDQPI